MKINKDFTKIEPLTRQRPHGPSSWSWMLLIVMLLNLSLSLVVIEPAVVSAQTEERGLGGMTPDPSRSAKRPALATSIRSNLPTTVDYTPFLPPIGNQGAQNSCAAWATAYYYKTFQEGKKFNWTVNSTNHQFSPAFIYNQVQLATGRKNQGMFASEAISLMLSQGADTLASFPYNSSNYTTQPNATQLANAANYKAATSIPLWYNNDSIDVLRQYLANGDLFVLDIPVYAQFWNAWSVNSDYIVTSNAGTLIGYHEIVVVGYDDAKAAFRIANSWGTSWGNGGFIWLSYNFVKSYGVMADGMTNRNQLTFNTYPTLSGKVISFSTNRATNAVVKVNGTLVATSSTANTTHSLTISGLAPGSYNATVTITDLNGEFTSASLSINTAFTVGQGSVCSQNFVEAYNRKGATTLGQPNDLVKQWGSSGVYWQPFSGGTAGEVKIFHHQTAGGTTPCNMRAFEVQDEILEHYTNLGGPTSYLGAPTSDQLATSQSNFVGGYISWNGSTHDYAWPTTFSGWKVQYFSNANLQSGPSLVKDEVSTASNSLDFSYNWTNWQAALPQGLSFINNWSVSLERTYTFAAGNYKFSFCGDAGVKLYLNHALIIDQSQLQSLNCYETSQTYTTLTQVPVKLEYYRNSVGQTLSFTVTIPGTSSAINVTKSNDDNQIGSLSYALNLAQEGQIITIDSSITKITLNGSLTLKPGVILQGRCNAGKPEVTLEGYGLSGLIDSVVLNGRNNLSGIKIAKLSGKQLKVKGSGNKLSCVVVAQ
ncbi:MAG: hypothetical protein HXX20_20015 [Chloroflexi bacterium]|nr:hypothetical protein [Chloroflexota bacterium]